MPIGFMFLGLVLIFELFFEKNKLQKVFALIFCAFTMLGYFVTPLDLGNLSVNIIIVISALILLCYFAKDLNKKQKINLLAWGLFSALIYIVLTFVNSDYITTLNPYPISLVVVLISLFNLNNFKFVVSFNMFTFILLSMCNLIVESGLGYVNFASLELFNLILVILAVMVAFKLVKEFKNKTRSEQWKNF